MADSPSPLLMARLLSGRLCAAWPAGRRFPARRRAGSGLPRPTAHVRDRHGRVRARVGGERPGAELRDARHGPVRAGPRRGARGPALAPAMIAKGHGAIVNISTMAARLAVPGMSVYGATKAALESLTRTWATEFGGSGIRVNAIAPGTTRSDKVMSARGAAAEQMGAATPLGRTAATSEIARVAVFLASDQSSYLTGATIPVDGDRTAI